MADLASRALGGSVMATNDDFYGDVHQLLAPEPARHDPSEFGARGKTYDGWETRRRRSPGQDWVLIRLGAPGIVRAVDVDTSWFTGNYPPFASVDAVTLLGYPSANEVLTSMWTRLVDRAPLEGDSVNHIEFDPPDRLMTHLRLTIHPDGGVARFRAYGDAVPDPRWLGGRVDLAAVTAGAAIDGCSNQFYSDPTNVLKPGRAQVMSDGWETARRRDSGNDWLVVRLALPGVLRQAVVDTARFVGNAPAAVQLTDADTGELVLPRTRVQPDTEHRFRIAGDRVVERVRLDIFPDGGISRLRLLGEVMPEARASAGDRWLQLVPPHLAVEPGEFWH